MEANVEPTIIMARGEVKLPTADMAPLIGAGKFMLNAYKKMASRELTIPGDKRDFSLKPDLEALPDSIIITP